MYNINKGKNKQLMDACKTLKDYAEYTSRVRDYAREMEIEEAVERAITECIREGILADFLKKNRAEAKKMSIYEYDEVKNEFNYISNIPYAKAPSYGLTRSIIHISKLIWILFI